MQKGCPNGQPFLFSELNEEDGLDPLGFSYKTLKGLKMNSPD